MKTRRQFSSALVALGLIVLLAGCAQTPQGSGQAPPAAAGPPGAMIDPSMVRWAQQALQEAGFSPGNAAGQLTEQTRAALADFQRSRGLPPTGALDDRTAQYLATATGQTVPGDRDDRID